MSPPNSATLSPSSCPSTTPKWRSAGAAAQGRKQPLRPHHHGGARHRSSRQPTTPMCNTRQGRGGESPKQHAALASSTLNTRRQTRRRTPSRSSTAGPRKLEDPSGGHHLEHLVVARLHTAPLLPPSSHVCQATANLRPRIGSPPACAHMLAAGRHLL
jgi:hypothetical protein